MNDYVSLIDQLISDVSKIGEHADELKIINQSLFNLALVDFNEVISKFNDAKSFNTAINAQKLKAILTYPLPKYEGVLDLLINLKTKEKVITEFNNSDYLNEVWQIEDKDILYVNFLILIYRTTLLNWDSNLRKNGAQISSTLEEMRLY